MKETILDMLFKGRIYPEEQTVIRSKEFDEMSEKLGNEKSYFKSVLSEEDQQRFDELFDVHVNHMLDIYSRADFASGFKLGARLTHAAFVDESDKAESQHDIEKRFDAEMKAALLDAAMAEA